MENIKKILVVEDDKDLCDLIYQILLDENFEVKKVNNGDTALEMILNENYNLIIIDNKLKGMNGISVIKNAKKSSPNLRAIMISAYGTAKTKEDAKNIGVCDFIDKPFEISKLVESVRKFCN